MTILYIFVSLTFSWIIGYQLISSLLGSTCLGTRMIRCAMAMGNGLAVTSIFLFIWLLASHGNPTFYPLAETIFAVVLLGIIIFKNRQNLKQSSNTETPDLPLQEEPIVRRKITRVFWAIFVMATTSITLLSFSIPHGKWDAWAIWNLRARFIYRAGTNWTTAFSERISFSHTDYPLLLPLSVVKGWLYAGFETLASPMMIGIVFSVAILLLLFGSVMTMRSSLAAIFAATTLISTPFFLEASASQYADIPLSFFFLASLSMISLYIREPKPGLLVLAGLNAGFSAWTKNEGILFATTASIFVSTIAILNSTKQPLRKALASYFTGAILAMLPLLCFKLLFAPTNDLVREFASSCHNSMLELERYKIISSYMFASSLCFGKWHSILFGAFNPLIIMIAFLLQAGLQTHSHINWLMPGILLFMLVGYFFAYIISPHDLGWHLSTSCNRLFLQLWPSTILTFFLLAKPATQKLE